MNLLTKAGVGVALSGMLALPAFAGGYQAPVVETPVATPVVMPVMQTRNWTGGYVGGQLGYGDVSTDSKDGDGAIYGLRGGYDWDLGNRWIVGVGADIDGTSIDLDPGSDNLDWIARLKARGGYSFDQTWVYVTAGPAWASGDYNGKSETTNGWFAGVGAEYALNNGWTVGTEVLYNEFEDFGNSNEDLDGTTASLNVNFRF